MRCDPAALSKYVEGVLDGEVPGIVTRYDLAGERVGYWDPEKGVVNIEDSDSGTVFTPTDGKAVFDALH